MSDASAPVEAPASDSGPPYEISIPEVPVDQLVTFQIELRNPDGRTSSIGPLELPGIPSN